MKNLKVKLNPKQQIQIDKLLKQAKFDRIMKSILSDKNKTALQRSMLIVELKKKMFGTLK
jgi:histone H3/H4